MYAVMVLLQANGVREPGWGAVLDPAFFGFAVVLLLAIGVVLRLALRSDDESIEWEGDE